MTFLYKKVEAKRTLIRRGRGDRTHPPLASALLADPNAMHFGTRLRNTQLKTIINRFLDAVCLLEVRVLYVFTQQKRMSYDIPFLLVEVTGLEPAASSASRHLAVPKIL